MHKHTTLKLTLIIGALFASSFANAVTSTRAEYKAEKARIGTEYKADKLACAALSANAKDVCAEEAKAKESAALATVKFDYTGKPEDERKIWVSQAKGAYAVAKERCDDRAAADKTTCVSEAKGVETKALAEIKSGKRMSDAKAAGMEEGRNADYKVAQQKCDAMVGDAKLTCNATAKATYGKS
jgi:hypothetical protein